MRVRLGVALAAGVCWLSVAVAATPDAITADGGRYYGPLVEGKLHGRGRLEWENGAVYEGEFAKGLMSGRGRMRFANGSIYEGELRQGLMSGRGRLEDPHGTYEGEFKQDLYWGQGEVRYRDGRSYRGEFVRGDFQGKGRLENPSGDVYEGEFAKDDLIRGRYTRKDGARYEGEFKDWMFHGRGRYSDASGIVYEGSFVEGKLEGRGKATGQHGTYEGDFQHWQFHGQGVLRLPNGDVYKGAFAHGMYDGQGTLTYAKPKPDGRRQESGTWRYGYLPQPKGETNVEAALYSQKELLDKALASLKPREPGRINLYLLAVAGDGSQEVFRREVEFVQGEFARRFHAAGRSVALVNSRNTVTSAPMATLTSIRQALKAIAARMDPGEDILFLFLTSHGSHDHQLTLAQNGMELADLSAAELAAALKESAIRWKVVLVSACYSGGFVDALQDERTLFIAAARRDRRSFGCADENDFTHFGRAYFKEALPKSNSFEEAFRKAQTLVGEWERKHSDQSLPQMAGGAAIDAHLKRWWAQLPK